MAPATTALMLSPGPCQNPGDSRSTRALSALQRCQWQGRPGRIGHWPLAAGWSLAVAMRPWGLRSSPLPSRGCIDAVIAQVGWAWLARWQRQGICWPCRLLPQAGAVAASVAACRCLHPGDGGVPPPGCLLPPPMHRIILIPVATPGTAGGCCAATTVLSRPVVGRSRRCSRDAVVFRPCQLTVWC